MEKGREDGRESTRVEVLPLMSTSNGLCYKLYYYESRIMVLAERLQVEC